MILRPLLTENQVVRVDYIMKIFSKNKEKTHSKPDVEEFDETDDSCWNNIVEWETLEDEYFNDGKLDVEFHVKINKMIGFPLETVTTKRKELRSFEEDMKQFSDVILKVDDRKFYVSKLSLSAQSAYFASLFLGQFQESGKGEVELKGVHPDDLQYYLEVIYAEDAIDETTVQGILTIADMYDTPLVVEKCKQFLIKESKIGLKKKLELAGKYRLETLKKLCMDQINSKDDIRSVIPKNTRKMDHDILAELLEKALAFNG
ncbi:unnamed protein product [Caenorhabditis nigoni]